MDRVLRAIIHHPVQLLVLILLPVAIGSLVAFRLPRQYSATATLLALHQYDSLTATSVDSSSLDTQAGTQVTALNELLQSRSFALDVAQEANLASTLKAEVSADPSSRDDAMVTDISQHVIAQAQGSDLYTITYTGTNPQITQRVVMATLDHYQQVIQATVASEGQKLLGTYQTQLAQAQQTAQLTAAAGVGLHPGPSAIDRSCASTKSTISAVAGTSAAGTTEPAKYPGRNHHSGAGYHNP